MCQSAGRNANREEKCPRRANFHEKMSRGGRVGSAEKMSENCPGGLFWDKCLENVYMAMQVYKSPCTAVMICTTMVNTQTDRQLWLVILLAKNYYKIIYRYLSSSPLSLSSDATTQKIKSSNYYDFIIYRFSLYLHIWLRSVSNHICFLLLMIYNNFYKNLSNCLLLCIVYTVIICTVLATSLCKHFLYWLIETDSTWTVIN